MKYKTSKAVIAAAKAASVVMWNEFRYPQPVKGRYDVAGNKKEKLKWAYRCWVHQLEIAEKGSGIEEHLASQNLDFSLPEGFTVEREMTVTGAGDLMAVDCLTEGSTGRLFDGIRSFYMDTDLTCANLESCIWEKAPVGRNQVLGQPPVCDGTGACLNGSGRTAMGSIIFPQPTITATITGRAAFWPLWTSWMKRGRSIPEPTGRRRSRRTCWSRRSMGSKLPCFPTHLI